MQNLIEIGPFVPEKLNILVNLRWRLYRHFGSSLNVKTHLRHVYSINPTICKNLIEIGQTVPEILKILVNLTWRLYRHFGSSLKVKTHLKHICSLSATTRKI